mmetsp:Transcript_28203/g.70775  ORF Transcript_28203/g.70775 Transcript_28203/m.70775 type:complete len:230 (-) Transcript_28203:177-866(-)
MTCPTPSRWHSLAMSTTASHARGAKQLVEVTTQHTFSAPAPVTAASTPATSVSSWSPTSLMGTTKSSSPAASTALTHVFWSRRHHTTLVAVCGRCAFIASKVMVSVMPVARGSTSAGPISASPANFMASATRRLVSLLRREEPAALGCSAATSPDLPMPCARPQCLLDTRGLYTRASLSPTPTLSRKLLLSIMDASAMKASMEASSHPFAGRRRSESKDVRSFERRLSA